MIKTIGKNIVYIVLGMACIVVVGMISQVLVDLVHSNDLARYVGVVFILLICRWLGENLVKKD